MTRQVDRRQHCQPPVSVCSPSLTALCQVGPTSGLCRCIDVMAVDNSFIADLWWYWHQEGHMWCCSLTKDVHYACVVQLQVCILDKSSVMARWQDHFTAPLNRPLYLPASSASTPDPLIDTFPPMLSCKQDKGRQGTRTLWCVPTTQNISYMVALKLWEQYIASSLVSGRMKLSQKNCTKI